MARVARFAFSAVCILSCMCLAQPTEGLVAYWAFNEWQGDIAFDLVGGNSGLLSHTEWSGGVVGGAIVLDGGESYVDCGSAAGLISVAEFTIAAWVRFSTEGVSRAIVAVANGVGAQTADYGVMVNHTDVGTIRVLLSDGSQLQSIRGVTPIGDAAWHHVAVVMNASAISLYVDGKPDAKPVDRTVVPQVAGAFRLFLGDLRPLSTATAWKLNGGIDEVRIYNRALSAEQIGVLYSEEGRGIGVSNSLRMGGIALAVVFLPS